MLYRQLAEHFMGAIEAGQLPAYGRMPSLRQVVRQHQVSMTTALKCFEYLEQHSWIESKPQSGYFVLDVCQRDSPELSYFQGQPRLADSVLQPPTIADGPLGYARLGPDPILAKQLGQALNRAHQRLQGQLNQYPRAQGELFLRQALATHFAEQGLISQPDDWLITHGAMDAVRRALNICTHKGDAVAISSPCYNGLLQLLAQMGRQVVEIPSMSDGVDLSQLEALMKQGQIQAALFCTSHMNPQGVSMSASQKQQLAMLANRYQIPVIEDDVYLELSHSGVNPLPAKYYDTGGYLIWCGAVSKTLGAAYRLGWCIPSRYLRAMLTDTQSGCFGVATPIQHAVADYLDSGLYRRYLKRVNQQLRSQCSDYRHRLAQALPAAARISQPQGGLVLWVQLPDIDTTMLVADGEKPALDIQVGAQFTTRELYGDCLRINFGYPLLPESEAEHSLQRLLEQLAG
ncbi:aminotransferase-like domain-containing protein [Celerinatantimonas yamalensis]|uniref:PLP-dependent aminotransferase family protein n=1 Tax=Celerinatantimonas yamalensis TaxID=559956 RepID=A0ABW9G4N9_9GAMM